jgi:hypothetical protein
VPLYLPGRQIQGEMHPVGTLPGIALVGDERGQAGPCAELACARLCETMDEQTQRCPCTGDDTEASAASVEIAAGLPVVILPDTHPLLQALRNELRPALADVDGLLGMSALTRLVVSVDYGQGAVVAKCSDPSDPECLVRPRGISTERRNELKSLGCLPGR